MSPSSVREGASFWGSSPTVREGSVLDSLTAKHPQAREGPAGVDLGFQFLRSFDKEDVPRPAPDVRVFRVINLRPIAKLIAELVGAFRQFIVKRD